MANKASFLGRTSALLRCWFYCCVIELSDGKEAKSDKKSATEPGSPINKNNLSHFTKLAHVSVGHVSTKRYSIS